jgi:hypothetical protein
VAQIREAWPELKIVLRGDSGFCRNELMSWCENNGVDFFSVWRAIRGCAGSSGSRCMKRLSSGIGRANRRGYLLSRLPDKEDEEGRLGAGMSRGGQG